MSLWLVGMVRCIWFADLWWFAVEDDLLFDQVGLRQPILHSTKRKYYKEQADLRGQIKTYLTTYNPPRPFPRWGDTIEEEETLGIQFAPILDFILNSSSAAYAPRWHHKDPAYICTNDHTKDVNGWFPETLYVVDAHGLWTSQLHRNITNEGKGSVKDKLVPIETIRAWDILHDKESTNAARWPRLHELLLKREGDTDDKAIGFPYLAWYGDYTGCNYRNWKNKQYSIPLFTTAANVNCNFTFPIPTYQIVKDSKNNTLQWELSMKQNGMQYPWHKKRKQVVWRGALTGRILNETHRSPRWKMLEYVTALKQQHIRNRLSPEDFLLDAGATRLPLRHHHWNLSLDSIGGLVNRISPMSDFQQYRGILDIDGNSWSSRFGALLCSNSVILKVEPEWVDYFHWKRHHDGRRSLLQPWKHYIPVRTDLSDLMEVAAFVADIRNDKILRDIVSHANVWCRQYMIRESVARDMLDIWERYVELLDIGSPDWVNTMWKHAKEEIFASSSPLDMVLLNTGLP